MSLELEALLGAVKTEENAAYFNLLQRHFVLINPDETTTDLTEEEIPSPAKETEAARHQRFQTLEAEFKEIAIVGPNEKNVRGFLGTLYAGIPSSLLNTVMLQANLFAPKPEPEIFDYHFEILADVPFLFATDDVGEARSFASEMDAAEKILEETLVLTHRACSLMVSSEQYVAKLPPKIQPFDGLNIISLRKLVIWGGDVQLKCRKESIPL